MNRAQLEHALRAVGTLAKDKDLIVFGSQAILGLVPKPPKSCLHSKEVDIYPKHAYQAVPLLVAKLGRRSSFAKRNSFFVDVVSPDLATLPGGWSDRLVPFSSAKTDGVTGWCLEIHDLVVSKLAAGRRKDMEYILVLLRRQLVSPGIIENRIQDTATTASEKHTMAARLSNLVGQARRRPGKRHTTQGR
jgi:hypothetical protein